MTTQLSYAVDLWDGYVPITKRCDDAITMGKVRTDMMMSCMKWRVICQEIANFLSKRIKLEQDYAKDLGKLCKSTATKKQLNLAESGTMLESYLALLNETDKICTRTVECCSQLTVMVLDNLNSLIKELETQRKAVR